VGMEAETQKPPRSTQVSLRLALALGLLAALCAATVASATAAAKSQHAHQPRQKPHAQALKGPLKKSRSTPGPGQFLFMKTESLELQSWDHEVTVGGGILSRKGAFSGLIPTEQEDWLSAKQRSRQRLVMGSPRFLSRAEQVRWERAGSPLPAPFEGKRGGELGVHIIEVRRGVRDVEDKDGPGFADFSSLPTEPKALRLAIEHRQVSDPSSDVEPASKPIDSGRVIGELWGILERPNTTAALRAAVFGALAELPGVELDRNAKDPVGRFGSALSYERKSSGYDGEQHSGMRVEYIFDPETSAILGRRQVITDPEKISWAKGIPAGTVDREVAYLRSGIVGSTDERPGEPEATASREHRK
jgi:hypothetical protein